MSGVASACFLAGEGGERGEEIRETRPLQRRKRQGARHLHGGNADTRRHHAVDHAFAEFCRKAGGKALADDLVHNIVTGRDRS